MPTVRAWFETGIGYTNQIKIWPFPRKRKMR
jgi:hypothetical protein